MVYKPREEGSIYLSYGTSEDPTVDAGAVGAALSDVPTAANNVNLDPEESQHYEVGTKWNLFDARLLLSAAVFRTEKTNVRTRLDNTTPFVLSGEHQVDGVELGVTGSITENWSAFGGLCVSRREDRKQRESDRTSMRSCCRRRNIRSTCGRRTRCPSGWSIGAGAQFIDEVVRSRTGTSAAVVENILSSYWLVDAMASYPLTDSITLRLNAGQSDGRVLRRSHRRRALRSGRRPLGLAHGRHSILSRLHAVACAKRPLRGSGERLPQGARRRGLDRRPRHGRPSIGSRQGQPAVAGGCARCARTGRARCSRALERNPLFLSAALPAKIFPPLFNCYRTGQSFGVHVDNAVRQFRGSAFRIRTDLSVTLFLSSP